MRYLRGVGLAALCSAACLSLGAAPAMAKSARIGDLLVQREGERLLVSFQLADAFDDSLIERIETGLPTGFTYHIKLERLRRYWWNRRFHRSQLEVIAMYNALTREYLVNYKQDGRLIDSRVVKSRDELRRAMTMLHALPVYSLDQPRSGRWVVRVRAELGSRTVLLLFPTTRHTAWAESPTFTGLGPPATASDAVRSAANPDTR